MFTATEMNRISNNNFELNRVMFIYVKEIEDKILTNAFNGKKYVKINIINNNIQNNKKFRIIIQFLRNRGYDVKITNNEMLIRW